MKKELIMGASIEDFVKNHDQLLYILTRVRQHYYRVFFSDEKMVRYIYKKRFGREPNLQDPQTFAEKIQWLKLNWYDELAVKCADKFLVREYIESRIGAEYLNDLLGVYEDIEKIDISALPDQFVLKGTHGSHFNIICRDKTKLDWKLEKAKLKRWSTINYYWQNREWVYRDLKPAFIVEKFLDDKSGSSLTDYKFYCFNGDPAFCQVIKNRGKNESIDFYDLNWEHLPFTGLRRIPFADSKISKPEGYEKMVELARALAQSFPFVRADFYNIEGRILFGELTFFPQSGLGEFTPIEYDRQIANKMILPQKQ